MLFTSNSLRGNLLTKFRTFLSCIDNFNLWYLVSFFIFFTWEVAAVTIFRKLQGVVDMVVFNRNSIPSKNVTTFANKNVLGCSCCWSLILCWCCFICRTDILGRGCSCSFWLRLILELLMRSSYLPKSLQSVVFLLLVVIIARLELILLDIRKDVLEPDVLILFFFVTLLFLTGITVFLLFIFLVFLAILKYLLNIFFLIGNSQVFIFHGIPLGQIRNFSF